jgi:protein gp37
MQILTPSMPDPFHPDITDESLDQFMATVALTPQITYEILTEMPDRMCEYIQRTSILELESEMIEFSCLSDFEFWQKYSGSFTWPLPNLYLGVSVENQAAADERIPWLLKTPAAKRFLSVEPLLEKVDLSAWMHLRPCPQHLAEKQAGWGHLDCDCQEWRQKHIANGMPSISQVIVGGESGPGARPFHLEWARSLQQQCKDSGTAFFLKQVGSNPFLDGEPLKLKDRKGGDLMELPEELRVREII